MKKHRAQRKRCRVIYCLLGFLLLFSCSKEMQKKADERWAQYIKAHTYGQISRESMIRVIFTQDLVAQDKIGQEADDIISFSPGIDGKAEWSAPNAITFVPEESLPSGKQYKAELDLEDYVKTAEDLDDFFFYFETIKQDFDFTFQGLVTPDLKKLNVQEFHGTLYTADVVDNKKLEGVLKANQQGKTLQIGWNHKANRKQHDFIIKEIQRKKADSQITLAWNGDDIDVEREGEKEIAVPAKGVFKIVEVAAYMTDEQFISVRFSDPLKPGQNLRGLVQVEGAAIRLSIDKNIIRIYPQSKINGKAKVRIERGIKNSEGKKLTEPYTTTVTFESVKPAVRFVGKGTILPEHQKLTVPFEAVNVHSVQVTAFKVYAKNMGHFFQVNSFKGSSELKRVGRFLWRKTIQLNAAPEVRSRWSRYNLDVTELFEKHPNSLFRLTLSINRSNSVYRCAGNQTPPLKETAFKNADDYNDIYERSSWEYAEQYYSEERNNWSQRENPCHDAYYNKRYNSQVESSRNFISSNIGIIAKLGQDNRLNVVTTDIRSAEPLSTKVTVYNFQNHEIGTADTDGSGLATIAVDGKPFYIAAEKKKEKGYLKVDGDSTLPLSHFDVGGETTRQGVKGYIYGERGVWRPGDDIYLTFVLEDKNDLIPDNHPIHLELYNPRGQLVHMVRKYKKVNDFYAFKTGTGNDDPTGNWKALIRLGGIVFEKLLKVESVVPNRLRVKLDFGREELHASMMPVQATLFSQWLHGATAANLRADVAVRLTSSRTAFNRYKDFIFDDPSREFKGEKEVVYDGVLDGTGNASFTMNIPVDGHPSGMLQANFTSRVFEEGGGYSTEVFRIPFHPYRNYVGLKTPKGGKARGMLLTDKTHTVQIATVDSEGKPVSLKNVEVTLYKIQWRYWWDKSGASLANFTSASSTQKIASGVISTKNGSGSWNFMVKYPSWGRYLIRAVDREGRHSSAKIVYIDWPGWAGRAREEKGVGATRLNFTADKEEYTVGEDAIIYLPSVEKGRALVSLENGTKILKQFWMKTSKGKNKIKIDITKEMSPNVYVHVTFLQPHKDKTNDSPIRLYGVIPLLVKNPKTIIKPVLRAPEELHPLKKATFKVREKNGRPMTYTLALVDEGLLGLTRYKTPELHDYFYKREALGVRTWDMFDDVVGAYGATLERILALGGDEGLAEKKRETKKRFPPVVKFLGPFSLKSGKTNTHKIEIPKYIGAIRVMVVAGEKGAYGSTDKSIPVRQPMMVMATMPRVIGPGEELTIPVTVFANSKSIKKVAVKIKTDENLQLQGSSSQSITFAKPDEKLVFFRVKVKDIVGTTRVVFTASSGNITTDQDVTIQIRNANPITTKIQKAVIEPGKSWKGFIMPHGIQNTNSASLELSTMPPLNLGKRLQYLITYPHGCIEQTVSSVFPQLYLDNLLVLPKKQQEDIEQNIKAAIERLRQFQLPSGGFVYWPGQNADVSQWGTNYAGHFLLEAEKKGYYVPAAMLTKWKKYQKSTANNYRSDAKQGDLVQAYRLYTLSLAKTPQLGALNRLREAKELATVTRWQLAAAFALAGQQEAAESLIQGVPTTVDEYTELGYTYGSDVRDKAIILSTLTIMQKKAEGKELALLLSRELSSEQWYSTQTTAYALLALAEFTGKTKTASEFSFTYTLHNKKEKASSSAPVYMLPIEKIDSKGMELVVENTNKDATLYLMVTSKGSPKAGTEQAASQGLALQVEYRDTGNHNLDPVRMNQGEDFIANIRVTNTGRQLYKNLVLSQIVPSGWQIHNTRFEGAAPLRHADYQDFRDDRVYTYFSLKPNESKIFKVHLNASFLGRYYMPGIAVEAMYDASIRAIQKGRWVVIEK